MHASLKNAAEVIRRNKGAYALWTASVFGGFLVPGIAAVTVWYYHRTSSVPSPTPELLLVTAIVTIGVVGYENLLYWRGQEQAPPSPLLAYGWILIPTLTYGMLVAVGVAPPTVSLGWLWAAGVVVALIAFVWASLLWSEVVERTPRAGKKEIATITRVHDESKEDLLQSTNDLPAVDLSASPGDDDDA